MKKELLHFTAAVLFMGCVPSLCEGIEKESFSLTLMESIEIALEKNPEILIQREKIKESEAGIKEAKSGLLPSVGANASYYNYRDHPYLPYDENYEADISIVQTLYSSRRLSNAFRQSKLNLKSQGEIQCRVRQTVIFNVKEAFYKVLLGKAFVNISREALSMAEEQLKAAKSRYSAGEVSDYDVLRSEVEVARIKPELVKSENYLEVVKNRFKFTLGMDLDSEAEIEGEFVYVPEKVDFEKALSTAFSTRPELKELEFRIEMGELGVRIARGLSKPDISLIIGNYWSKESFYSPGDEWDDYLAGVVSVSVPIFDGWRALAKTREAAVRLNILEISYKNLKEKVKLEVKNACLNLESARKVVASQVRNVDRAEEGLKIMQARYKEGKTKQLDLIDAEFSLSRARVDHAESIYEYIIAMAVLELAVGE